MIEIVKEKTPTKGKKPYYKLVYNYMIGDANGYTKEEVNVSVDNPFIERYVTLLNKLKPVPGTWGVMLTESRMYDSLKDKQITDDDYNFLCALMFEEPDVEEEYFKTDKEKEFASYFYEGVNAETEYSFLVFQGIDLYYYDEFGKKNATKIKK